MATNETAKSTWPWVAALLLLGAATRTLYLIQPALDSDMAVVGLMGLHALQGELTPLYWGQDYGGSLESLLAALLFALLGVSPRVLDAAPALISLAHLAMVFLVGRELAGRRVGLAALAMAATGPYYLLWFSASARGLHAELLALGGLLMLLTLRLLRRDTTGPAQARLSLAWGLVAGVGVWNNLLMAFTMGPALLLLWRERPRLPLSRAGLLMGLGFIVGAAPLLSYNLANDWGTLEFILKPKPHSGLADNLTGLALRTLPVLLGAQMDYTYAWVAPGLGQAVLVAAAAAAAPSLWAWGRSLGRRMTGRGQADGWELPLLVLLAVGAGFCLLGGADLATHRHALSFYLVWPLMAAWAFAKGLGRGGWARAGAWLGLALLICSNLAGALLASPTFAHREPEAYRSDSPLTREIFAFFRDRGIGQVYCDDYWLAPLWTFMTREETIFVQPHGDRHPPYLDDLLRRGRAAWITQPPAIGPSRGLLRRLGASFHENALSDDAYTVFWDIAPPGGRVLPLDPAGFSIQCSARQEDGPRALDLDAGTRWTTHQVQAPGQYMVIDLGRVVPEVCQLMLFSGVWEDRPGNLRLEGSPDGRAWEPLAQLKDRPNPAYWSGGVPVMSAATPWEEVRFAPRPLRYLRLEQRGASEDRYWSVVEALVGTGGDHGDDAESADLDAAAAWLAQALPGEQPLWCEPALAARLPRRLRAPSGPRWTPAGLPAYLRAEQLMPARRALRFAVRLELLALVQRGLAAGGWETGTQVRHGVALVEAVSGAGAGKRLYWAGFMPLLVTPGP